MPSELRRMRRTEALRNLVRESRIHPTDLIYPILVGEGLSEAEPIPSMPGQYRHPVAGLPMLAGDLKKAGVTAVLLFGVPSKKDDAASEATRKNGVVQEAVKAIRTRAQKPLSSRMFAFARIRCTATAACCEGAGSIMRLHCPS